MSIWGFIRRITTAAAPVVNTDQADLMYIPPDYYLMDIDVDDTMASAESDARLMRIPPKRESV